MSKKRLKFDAKKLLLVVIALLSVSTVGLGLMVVEPQLTTSSTRQEARPTPVQNYPEVAVLRQKKDASFQQITEYLTYLAKKKGAEYAFGVLQRADLPPNFDIHLLAHAVGDVLYAQKGVKGIQVCTDDFRNACSHSIVIAHLMKFGPQSLNQIADTCHQAPGGKGAYTMCFHGLGHGVLAYNDYDMEKAVAMCKRTGTVAYDRREYIECVGGVMMEMASGVHDPKVWMAQKTRYFSSSDPLSPCDMDFMEDVVRPQCYQYLTPHLFEAAGADLQSPSENTYKKAFTYCDLIGQDRAADRDSCYSSFGKEFVVIAQQRDIRKIESMSDNQLKKIASWCNLAPNPSAVRACNLNVINSLFWGGENDSEISVRYCNALQTKDRGGCFDHLIQIAAYYLTAPETKQILCERIDKSYPAKCAKKISINS